MSYFNHAFKKAFVATKDTIGQSGGFNAGPDGMTGTSGENAGITNGILTSTGVHVSMLKSVSPTEGFQLGPGVIGLFDSKTNLSIDSSGIAAECCPFYIAGASIKLNDKQGPFHGGYQESNKSKIINPKYIRRLWKVIGNTGSQAVLQIGGTPDNIAANSDCQKEFLCGETYYLRVDVKGTPALRFANHNLSQVLQADGGCCDDPAAPTPVDPVVIYLQWATQIAENPYISDFVNPILVVDGDSYAYNEELAIAAGLASTQTFANAPTTSTNNAGIILLGAYVDTKFGDCTFQTSDYYGKEPIQLYASEVDVEGDPCTFGGVCVTETCPGIQANGIGEQKVRELVLSESYLQNFMASDLRIREITQGTRAYEVLDRTAIYSSFFILHSVPRYNNPTGVFDNDQYLLEIIGNEDMVNQLDDMFTEIIDAGCMTCAEVEDHSGIANCSFTLPVQTP